MGHVDIRMLRYVYAHLGEIRARGSEVSVALGILDPHGRVQHLRPLLRVVRSR